MLIYTPHPILFQLGSVSIRWYSLMYILGFVLCYFWYTRASDKHLLPLSKDQVSDLLLYGFVGLLIGARSVYMLVYDFPSLANDPLSFFAIWNGGLSFHGALIGIVIALWIYLHKQRVPILAAADQLIFPIPLTLFMGRIGNFLNGELYGRIATDGNACIVFTNVDGQCRYPSQVFEALGEGLLLFGIMWLLVKYTRILRHHGQLFGVFLSGYGIIRFIIEFTRQPDVQIGFIFDTLSMGQLLCIPLILAGLAFVFATPYVQTRSWFR